MIRLETHFGVADGAHPRHRRQAIAECASRYRAHLSLESEGRAIRIESLISVLSMELRRGLPLAIIAEGEDANAAAESMRRLIEG